MSSVPPRSRWSVIVSYSLLVAVTQLLWVTFTPITKASADYWDVSIDAVGWLSQIFPLAYVVLALPFGYWADRSFKGSLTIGALLTGIGAIVRVFHGYEFSLVGQILISVGQPLVLNGVNKLAAQYIAPERRPLSIAIGSASLFVGIMVSTVSSPFLMRDLGMNSILEAQACISVCAVLLFLFALLRARPDYMEEMTASPAPIRDLWSRGWVKQYSFLLFLGFGLFVTLTTWLEVLSTEHGFTGEQVGFALGAMTLAGIVGAAFIPEWAIPGLRGRGVLCASLAVSAVMLITLFASSSFWLFAALLALSGCLLLANLPIILSSAETQAPSGSAGTVTAVLLLFGNLGGIVLTLGVQFMLGSRIAAIGFLIVAVAVTVPVALRFPSLSGNPPRDHVS
ncbi:MFS transporter [Cohnella endophytica]|uniref:MFS transporter n=1 Tax=Cohnella endophytica TaxID=2419778 RepID=A0A494X3R6_9BACL|nr:MFS transporter [Cohnella endophytica]RKP44281.1 MFS transporter [Cohnella endophytica]